MTFIAQSDIVVVLRKEENMKNEALKQEKQLLDLEWTRINEYQKAIEVINNQAQDQLDAIDARLEEIWQLTW